MKSFSIIAAASALAASALATPSPTLIERDAPTPALAAAFTESPFPFYLATSDGNVILSSGAFVDVVSSGPTIYTLQGKVITTADGTAIFGAGPKQLGQPEPVVDAESSANGGEITPLNCAISGTYPTFKVTCADGVNKLFYNHNGQLELTTAKVIKGLKGTPIQLYVVPTTTVVPPSCD